MRKDELVKTIRESNMTLLPKLLEEAKKKQSGRTTYVCPICGHGKNGDGLAINPKHPEQIHCFGCGFNGDVIDLYRQQRGSGYIDAIKDLGWLLCQTLDENSDRTADKTAAKTQKPASTASNGTGGATGGTDGKTAGKPNCAASEDFSEYFRQCRENLEKSNEAKKYLEGRGISADTIRRFGIGFDPIADPAKSNHYAPRVIIPTSSTHYVARAIEPNTYKAIGPIGASPCLFNSSALKTGGVVYVTEGVFDAMSITEAGGLAVAINSVANIRLLVDAIKSIQAGEAGEEDRTPRMVIIALDNDEAGKRAGGELGKMLDAIHQPFFITDRLSAQCKDANELLIKDRQTLADNVFSLAQIAIRPHGVATYILNSMITDIETLGNPHPTGMKQMDEILGGGMRAGLHVLGAMSSAGKTTLALQIAQGLAEHGAEVLYFSLEQSVLELTAKLIARQAYITNEKTTVSAMGIMDGAAITEEADKAATALCDATGNRLNIYAAPFGMTTSDVCNEIDRHRQATGTTPVVIVDYLQAITPDKERPEARLAIDDAVRMLAIKSKEIATPILVLSSLNRQAYRNRTVGMEGLKESGGIEYTADYLWGLTFATDGETETISPEDIIKAKGKTPRKMIATLIKGRCCSVGNVIYLDYYPAHDHFKEVSAREFDYNEWYETAEGYN